MLDEQFNYCELRDHLTRSQTVSVAESLVQDAIIEETHRLHYRLHTLLV